MPDQLHRAESFEVEFGFLC